MADISWKPHKDYIDKCLNELKSNAKQTNGDRIRTMSDEELADFLAHFKCGNCMRNGNNCFPGNMEDWLKAEVTP